MADETKIQNNEIEQDNQNVETVISNAKDIINLASESIDKAAINVQADDNKDSKLIVNSFEGLPLETLIGSPFLAAAKAQQELTATYVETVWDLAYGKEQNKNAHKTDDGIQNKVNTLNLTIERPIISENGNVEKKDFTVSAPILSLVPVPAFTMDEVVVDFNMEVKNSEISTEHTGSGVESSLDYKSFWGVSAHIKGSLTADSEHKRETDTSATYKIHARAVQHPPAAGMDKLTDILTQTMEPIIVPSQNPSPGKKD